MHYIDRTPSTAHYTGSRRSHAQSSKVSSRQHGSPLLREAPRDPPVAAPSIDSRRSPLHNAALAGDLQDVQRLIVRGGSGINQPDRLGFTPLHLAVSAGSPLIVNYLLDAGAMKSINTPAFAGYTPLVMCCNAAKDSGVPEIAHMLLQAGADTDAYVSGFGAARHASLHIAAIKGHTGIVRALLACGVDVNQTLEGGSITALALANQYGHADLATLLLSKGGVESSRASSSGLERSYPSRGHRRPLSPESPFLIAQELARRRAARD